MHATVGIFDSGVGGLSVAGALHHMRPALPIRYLADTAYFPYGDRAPAEIAARALALAQQLVDEGAALLVVACNTASSAALEMLRARFALPIVGMEPPLKPAVERSRSRRVAVLATPGTSASGRLARLRDDHGVGAEVAVLPMPGLADLVEAGEVTGPRVQTMLREALAVPLRDGIDAIALGCTHYGFLRATLARLVPPEVELIDAAEPVARRALSLLTAAGADPGAGGAPAGVRWSATGGAAAFAATLERLRAAGVALPPLVLEPAPAPVGQNREGARR
ncbi:MAG: glutamate racemase [Chloroflexi bacterium]|nr:glutamate racemase [Chloroflexota bacterium]